jgi:hypothetical protein
MTLFGSFDGDLKEDTGKPTSRADRYWLGTLKIQKKWGESKGTIVFESIDHGTI